MLRILRILVILIAGQSLISTPLIHAAKPLIPTGDLVSPKIDHKVIADSIEVGTAYQLKAKVTDNVGVDTVLLFYRVVGTETYKRVQMTGIEGTDEYTVTLGYEETVEPGIEYYFQAIDYDGNSLLYGYSFSPLLLRVAKNSSKSTADLAQDGASGVEAPTKIQEKKINKWVWIGLGVLAAGVLAAVAGGDDSIDSDSAAKPDIGIIVIDGLVF